MSSAAFTHHGLPVDDACKPIRAAIASPVAINVLLLSAYCVHIRISERLDQIPGRERRDLRMAGMKATAARPGSTRILPAIFCCIPGI
jgi:hypothetical protein